MVYSYTDALAGLANEIASAGVRCAVMRGLDNWPTKVGRDIDFLVAPADSELMLQTLRSYFQSLKWPIRVHRRFNGHLWCFVEDPYGRVHEIDLVQRLTWGFTILAEVPNVRDQVAGFPVDPWAAFAKRILLQVLGGDLRRFVVQPDRLEVSESERQHVPVQLAQLVGERCANQLLTVVAARDVDGMARLAPSLRVAVMRTGLRSPKRIMVAATSRLQTEIAASRLSPAIFPTIALVGVDGVGKSTTLDALALALPEHLPVTHVVRRHWRPFVLPALGRLLGHSSAAGSNGGPPRRHAGPLPRTRLMYFAIDYILGRWLDRCSSMKLAAVLYDRCSLDISVDPIRFGIRPNRGESVFRRRFAQPDIVVLLCDTPSRIHARKPELSLAEICEQQERWFDLARRGDVDLVIKTRRPPRVLAQCIAQYVVRRTMSERCA
jgi:hypothetical protein